jgi:hypothetical protein
MDPDHQSLGIQGGLNGYPIADCGFPIADYRGF